ncbi:endonuclease [Bacillus sp. FJAT-50079]|nr:endonuclease [Bacillus sp. FJAT-50079]
MLTALEVNRKKLARNEHSYFDKKKDQKDKIRYYRHINLHMSSNRKKFIILHQLITHTHRNKLPYFISKDEFLYTWVDLHPNGAVKNIYSGAENDPADLMRLDAKVHAKHEDLDLSEGDVPVDLKFNAEHIVPQSWFGGREPMKGDLHHLFACEPKCNATRSNFPYHDFSDYHPESPDEKIRNHCGFASLQLFEPENGKGTVARAMLYFILRYPNAIKKSYRKKINFSLLRDWNEQFPPTIYEQHRNQAIFQIQGNRNPFIDFPELMDRLYFPT